MWYAKWQPISLMETLVCPEAREPTIRRRTPPRRLPVGAEVLPGGGVHFRVWADRNARIEVVVEDGMASELVLAADQFFIRPVDAWSRHGASPRFSGRG
jgi:hypothetical protein